MKAEQICKNWRIFKVLVLLILNRHFYISNKISWKITNNFSYILKLVLLISFQENCMEICYETKFNNNFHYLYDYSRNLIWNGFEENNIIPNISDEENVYK